jgi:hypothetical protein
MVQDYDNQRIHSWVREKNWEPFYKRLWQHNCYEYIIRNEESLNSTRLYIQTNPAQWDADSEKPMNV